MGANVDRENGWKQEKYHGNVITNNRNYRLVYKKKCVINLNEK